MANLTPVELQILLALTSEPRHGYGIKLDVESRSQGAMKLGSGALYEATQRMEKHGWLEVAQPAGHDPAESRRKYYRLTAEGRGRLERDAASWPMPSPWTSCPRPGRHEGGGYDETGRATLRPPHPRLPGRFP